MFRKTKKWEGNEIPARTAWNVPCKVFNILKFSPVKSLKSTLNTCKQVDDSQYPWPYPYFSTTLIDYIPETEAHNPHFLHSDIKHFNFSISISSWNKHTAVSPIGRESSAHCYSAPCWLGTPLNVSICSVWKAEETKIVHKCSRERVD